jgi:hypothetical protein
MEIAVMAGLAAIGNVDVETGQELRISNQELEFRNQE